MKQESSIGARLRTVMAEQGLSYEQLGERLHMNPQTLNRYVLGQREPKIGTAAAMARALGVDPLWLQGFDVPRVPAPQPMETSVVPILGTIRAGTPLLAQQDLEGQQIMRLLGKNMAWMLKMREMAGQQAGEPEKEKKIGMNFIR